MCTTKKKKKKKKKKINIITVKINEDPSKHNK
jgi:hypothetical protein